MKSTSRKFFMAVVFMVVTGLIISCDILMYINSIDNALYRYEYNSSPDIKLIKDRYVSEDVPFIPDYISPSRYLTGSGNATSGILSIPRRMNVLSVTNMGAKGVFQIIVHYLDGVDEYVVDEYGNFSGEVMWERKGSAPLYIEIISDGDWALQMGYEDEELRL